MQNQVNRKQLQVKLAKNGLKHSMIFDETRLQPRTSNDDVSLSNIGLLQRLTKGTILPLQIRKPLKQAFGADFADIRIHNGLESDKLNRLLHAHAFTIGQDIFFSRGAYDPSTNEGKGLLAHELTHILQRNPSLSTQPYRITSRNETAEREAVSNQHAFIKGDPIRVTARLSSNDVARDYAEFQNQYPNFELEVDSEVGAIFIRGVLESDRVPLTKDRLEEILGLPEDSLQEGMQSEGLWIFPFSTQYLVNGYPNPELATGLSSLPSGGYIRSIYLRSVRTQIRTQQETAQSDFVDPEFEARYPAYALIIRSLRSFQTLWLMLLRFEARGLPGAERLISAAELLSDVIIRILLGITGVAGGLVGGVIEGIVGLASLLAGVLRYIIGFLFQFFSDNLRDQFNQYDAEVYSAIQNIVPALGAHFSGWWERFMGLLNDNREDEATVMLANAMGEIVLIIEAASAGLARVPPGTSPAFRIPSNPNFALAGGGTLAIPATVSVGTAESGIAAAGSAELVGQSAYQISSAEQSGGMQRPEIGGMTQSEIQRAAVRRMREEQASRGILQRQVREEAAEREIEELNGLREFTRQERAALVRHISEARSSLTPELRAELRPAAPLREAANISPERALEIREEMMQRHPLLRRIDNAGSLQDQELATELEQIMRTFGREENINIIETNRASSNVSIRREPGNLLFDPQLRSNPDSFLRELRHDLWYYYLELPSTTVGSFWIISWFDVL
jgi:hypothetical protein